MFSSLKITHYAVLLTFIASVCGGIYFYGYKRGQNAEREVQMLEIAKLQEQRIEQAKQLARVTADFITTRRENSTLKEALDDLAKQDPDADRPAFGSGSLQRLNEIR